MANGNISRGVERLRSRLTCSFAPKSSVSGHSQGDCPHPHTGYVHACMEAWIDGGRECTSDMCSADLSKYSKTPTNGRAVCDQQCVRISLV